MGDEQEHVARDPSAEWMALNAFNLARRGTSSVDEGYVFVRPLGGGVDDWPRLMGTIVAAAIANGQTVVMLPGTAAAPWQCLSTVQVPSGASILGTPETVVNVNLTGVTTADTPFTLAPGTLSLTAATAVDIAAGATAITSPITVPVNSVIVLSTTTGKTTMRYKVLAVTGSGPYTLTLDRPVLFTTFTVANATTISLLTGGSSNVTIDGQGMLVLGVKAGGLADFALAYRASLKNIVFDATGMVFNAGANPGIGFTACFDSKAEDVAVLQAAVTANVVIQTCESFFGTRFRVAADGVGGTSEGILVENSIVCTLRDTVVSGVTSMGCEVNASTDILLEGGTFTKCAPLVLATNIGCVHITNGSLRTKLVNLVMSYSRADGLDIDSTIAAPVGTIVVGCSVIGNANNGFYVFPGCLGTQITDVQSTGNADGDLVQADCVIHGYACPGNNAGGIGVLQLQNGANTAVEVDGIELVNTTASGVAIEKTGAGVARISNAHITLTAAGTALKLTSSGLAQVTNLTVDGAGVGTSTGINLASGTTLRVGANVDVDACATPQTIAGGAFISRAQFTANSTTPVSVAFAALKSTDRITTKVHTLGTVTVNPPEPLIIQTAGVGFTATSITTDTSVYDWTIL
jgi:hypothetical protein